jgi:hypothetical protein
MALTAKPSAARATECGVCGHTDSPCPSCPRLDGKPTRRDETWRKLEAIDRELAAAWRRSARAARNLAIRSESERDYSDWLTEYQAAGEALRALYGRRPALLGPQAEWSR